MSSPPTRADLADYLRGHDLEAVAGELAAAAQPCVEVRTVAMDESEIPVGASKMGGRPDLPAGFDWPRKDGKRLQFLLQIRCEDAAAHDATESLPRRGHLWFFYDVDGQPWGFDPKDRGGWAVRYLEDPGDLARAEDGGDAESPLEQACELSLRAVFSLPSGERAVLPLTEEQVEALCELPGDEEEDAPLVSFGHRLLGYPMPIQGDEMEEECDTCSLRARAPGENRMNIRDRAARWRLLMQVDTDDEAGVMWGDCGMLYFWIMEDALAARRFEDVWLVLQCY